MNEVMEEPCYMQIPEVETLPFVAMQNIGESGTRFVKDVTISFQSYADTLYKAAELNEKVKEAVYNMVSVKNISAVSLNSSSYQPDTRYKRYRYQALFVITYM